MEFNDAQNKFIQDLRNALSAYRSNPDPKLKAPATNLEWNLKKLTGEYAAESLDPATFVQRTKADLELVVSALPGGAPGQDFASMAISDLDSIFLGNANAAGGAVGATGGTSMAAAASTPTAGAGAPVDVKTLLAGKAKQSGEDLAWKTSVVDLLKLLGKDSSQTARHRYAVALGFPEAQIANMPSSEFNTWLHGQLMGALAHNGGNLPTNIA